MATDTGDETATVADRPGAKDAEATEILPADALPTIADKPVPIATPTVDPAASASLAAVSASAGSGRSLTTAADALHDEEVERTRLFIRMGWGISVGAIGTVFLLPAPLITQVAMIAAMVLGMVVSFGYHQRFGKPGVYNTDALLRLSVMSIINAHVAVLYYGAFTISPLIVVVGIHFVARTEAEKIARYIFATGIVCYSALSIPIIAGFDDPGVFATAEPLTPMTKAIAGAFVLGTYVLAYATARIFRRASLLSIDQLAKATRLASQRAALMDELRADLERALRIGGPGRYTEQTVGSFKLGIVLGRGAMGEVYDAVNTTSGAPAAVKLLRRELLADPTHVARFLREAKASSALQSRHVVRVEEISPEGAALPYLAMEKLTGSTLAELLRRESKLAPDKVVELIRDVGAGIDAAAAAGIVHRDLKPQNLFLTTSGLWKILDFGVATLSEDSGTLTAGGVIGTPYYMAPEQAQGNQVKPSADRYMLGAVAYRCLVGRHPFNGADTPAVLYQVVHAMPPRPSSIADVHADVDLVLAIAIAKDPDDRFASGAELATALADAVRGSLAPALRKRGEALIKKQAWE